MSCTGTGSTRRLDEIHVRRSTLIVPAGRRRFIEKSAATPTDVVMLDLDDGVVYTDEEKTAARRLVAQLVASGALVGKEVAVRTNALDTPWWRDESAELGGLGLRAFVPAKVDTARDFTAAADRGEAAVGANGGLIERVHVTVARDTLAVARELGLVDAAEFEAAGVGA